MESFYNNTVFTWSMRRYCAVTKVCTAFQLINMVAHRDVASGSLMVPDCDDVTGRTGSREQA